MLIGWDQGRAVMRVTVGLAAMVAVVGLVAKVGMVGLLGLVAMVELVAKAGLVGLVAMVAMVGLVAMVGMGVLGLESEIVEFRELNRLHLFNDPDGICIESPRASPSFQLI